MCVFYAQPVPPIRTPSACSTTDSGIGRQNPLITDMPIQYADSIDTVHTTIVYYQYLQSGQRHLDHTGSSEQILIPPPQHASGVQ